jgi:DNA-binding NarL/FixJ family response regulator
VTIRVLIVDDQELVRTGFRMILEAHPDLEVVGEANDGDRGAHLAQRLRPDVVLMDIRMPTLDGIAATRLVTSSEELRATRVVMLTTYDLDEYIFDALAAGASGFLLKDVAPEGLVEAIRLVARGDGLLAPTVTRRLINEFAHRYQRTRAVAPVSDRLTPRELEVLERVGRGLSNAEIAESLFLSENTVKTHVTHILDKLDLRDRVQAVIYAYETGIIEPGAAEQPAPPA